MFNREIRMRRELGDNKRDDKDMWASGLKPTRIEALSDGVFAIVITLLVLELSVPHFLGGDKASFLMQEFLEKDFRDIREQRKLHMQELREYKKLGQLHI